MRAVYSATLLVATPIPRAISPMIAPDSERKTAPIPAGPVGSPVLWRDAPSVFRVALIAYERRRSLSVQMPRGLSARTEEGASPTDRGGRRGLSGFDKVG